jgi:isoleucyl-tRNA synthetase
VCSEFHSPFCLTCISLCCTIQSRTAEKSRPPKEANKYAPTILLPLTEFSQRANAIVREPELQEYWRSTQLYQKLSDAAQEKSAPRFILHDGPPYANGELHIGHALNKLLKDFINRHKALQGFQVNYVPGWDCHGLPIELKVLQAMEAKEREMLTPIALRERAATFAKETTEKQSVSFQRYGVMGNWQQPYLTLHPQYEASQIRVFGEMFKKGYIFRGRKPVHWSPSSRTALAEAELEYPEGHISKSVYVALDIVQTPPSGVLDCIMPTNTENHNTSNSSNNNNRVRVAIWTTTPWTMPGNMAVAVNADLDYCVVDSKRYGKLIIATSLVPTLQDKLLSSNDEEADTFHISTSFKGADLVGATYKHPFYSRTSPIVAGGDYITTDSGTGLVHTAPGHGQEDYLTGLKYHLDLLSPVDDLGRFTIEAGEDLVGLNVLGEGNMAVIQKLDDLNALLKLENYGHKYPYDWRTKKPTIFRATDQWFASVEGFKDAAIEAINTVCTLPIADVFSKYCTCVYLLKNCIHSLPLYMVRLPTR